MIELLAVKLLVFLTVVNKKTWRTVSFFKQAATYVRIITTIIINYYYYYNEEEQQTYI